MARYILREVDHKDKQTADTIRALHQLCFGNTAPQVEPKKGGHWWIVFHAGEPVGFCCICQSTLGPEYGYLKRAGVLPDHRGKGLQRRMIRVREKKARENGWRTVITDTTANPHSSNSLIAAGYRMFEPPVKWAYNCSNYWRKDLRD